MNKSKNLQKYAVYLLGALFIPFLVICLTLFSQLSEILIRSEPKPIDFENTEFYAPKISQKKATILILASNVSTQVSDLLIPYAILSASDLYNVAVVAPEQQLSNTTAGLGIIPHYSFQSAPTADAVVIPAVVDHNDPKLIAWVRKQLSRNIPTLSVCEGARLLANTGNFDGKTLTSHFISIDELRDKHPKISWKDQTRVVQDGHLIVAAGITSAIDGSLKLIENLSGLKESRRMQRELSISKTTKQPAPPSQFEIGSYLFSAGLKWSRQKLGILVYPGVNEISMASFLDTYSRTFSSQLVTLAIARKPTLSQYGLLLIPELAATDAPPLDQLIIPNGARNSEFPKTKSEIISDLAGTRTETKDFKEVPMGLAYSNAITQIAQDYGTNTAAFVARMIELPSELLLKPFGTPSILLRLLVLIGLGLGVAHLVNRKFFNPRSSIQL